MKISLLVEFFRDLLDRSDNDSYLDMGFWRKYNHVNLGEAVGLQSYQDLGKGE